MNKKKLSLEILLLFLVAILFFIVGNMMSQLHFYDYVKDLFSYSQNSQNTYPDLIISEEETLKEINEITALSLNKLKLPENNEPLKFLVAGHIYGNPNEIDTHHPAITLLTNIQIFNQMELDLVVLLGDIVQESTGENFTYIKNNFFQYLQVPIFNAVGNHDVQNPDLYKETFGDTNFSFIYKDNLFIFLDTNIETFSLSENQLRLIEEKIKETEGNVETVHIFAHHVFYFTSPLYSSPPKYQTNVNYSMTKQVENFLDDVLTPLSTSVPIYIYTGDVGAWCGNLSPYYEKYKGSNIITIATGIGNCNEDSVLLVQEVNNEIIIEAISLTGKNMHHIEFYDSDYWLNK